MKKKDIPLPKNIFGKRLNSSGMDISEKHNLDDLSKKLKTFEGKKVHAQSYICLEIKMIKRLWM